MIRTVTWNHPYKRLNMRRNRVLIGVLGLDQHEVGAIGITRLLRDNGMEVVYTGKFNVPLGIVKTAAEEDVDLIGLSCHSWEYLEYVPELMALLKKFELDIPVVVGGSVITKGDEQEIREQGVSAAFGPWSTEQDILDDINRLISRERDS